MTKKIIFICTGNICRSPMAEYYLKYLLQKAGKESLADISSAGIYAENGDPATYESYEVLKKKYGIDMGAHRSQFLSYEKVYNADLLIVMTGAHKMAILQRYPDVSEKVHYLMEYSDERVNDVSDPWGQDIGVYSQCFEKMKNPIENLFLKLVSDENNNKN